MHAFEVLADPVRRRILELLATGEAASGSVVVVLQREFGISQPAVSQHLKVLRENGFATVRADGARRLYSVDQTGLQVADGWLSRFRPAWAAPQDAPPLGASRGASPGDATAGHATPGDATAVKASPLDALATEVARGKRARRAQRAAQPGTDGIDEIDEMRNIS
ncbi:MAG TPA: metalloregulator ArsR/SmtB family transcription factor [Kineosporiaceae bacterium]|nr:metalloregulator ArsR/SmtB family transcription factor [Kineosporiaceae bacterium]